MIGYSVFEKELLIKSDSVEKLEIELDEKTYDVDEVVVSAKTPEEWKNDRELFLRYFLGLTQFASECIVENSEVLEFKRENMRFNAYAKEPLIIINHALGYKITCDLVTFYYDENEHKCWMNAKYLFTELIFENDKSREICYKNRNKMYSSSMVSFLNWLNYKQLTDDAYELFVLNRLPAAGIEPVKQYVLNKNQIMNRNDNTNGFELTFEGYLSVKNNQTNEYSYINLLQDKVDVDESGYPTELKSLEVYGYWGRQGLANQLPKYYNPIQK